MGYRTEVVISRREGLPGIVDRLGAKTLRDAMIKFYSDPVNEANFQKWLKERQALQK